MFQSDLIRVKLAPGASKRKQDVVMIKSDFSNAAEEHKKKLKKLLLKKKATPELK